MADVGRKLIGQFARCLAEEIVQPHSGPVEPAPLPAAVPPRRSRRRPSPPFHPTPTRADTGACSGSRTCTASGTAQGDAAPPGRPDRPDQNRRRAGVEADGGSGGWHADPAVAHSLAVAPPRRRLIDDPLGSPLAWGNSGPGPECSPSGGADVVDRASPVVARYGEVIGPRRQFRPAHSWH